MTVATQTQTLRHPPIVEAVLDIECDFAPDQSIVGLEAAAVEKLRDRYPKLRKAFIHQVKFDLDTGSAVEKDIPVPRVSALQFLPDDEKQLVQFRDTGYSFNRLAPYSSLDEYLLEIQRTWDIFRNLTAPIQIRMVRLRYINRLNLPFAAGQINLNTYFKVGPRLPDEDRLSLVGFLHQHQLFEKKTGHRITTVLAASEVKGNKLPIIFDNMVAASVDIDPADWQRFEVTIKSLRRLKNRIFYDTLTPECLNLFQ